MWCSLDIMRQTAYLVIYPIIVDGYASQLVCTVSVQDKTMAIHALC